MKHLCREAGVEKQFEIASAAVSTEEIGNDIYPPAKRVLTAHDIPFSRRAARQITKADLDIYDHIICADRSNIRIMEYHLGEDIFNNSRAKVSMMMEWVGQNRDVSDPWYFFFNDTATTEIYTSCKAIIQSIAK